jgi:hypothetical protein
VPILILTVCAEILALVLRFTARSAYSAWALGLSTLPALAQVASEVREDILRQRGLTDSDAQLLGLELAIVCLALLSQWRFSRLFFWLGWVLNAVMIGVFGYVLFLWHPFA